MCSEVGPYAVGDTVLAIRNDYRQRILNGTRGTVTAIDEIARRLEATTDDGTTVIVPFAYAEARRLTHGYAMTIHKTQGATVGVALVLADETMTREQLYTALSRGHCATSSTSRLVTCAPSSRTLPRPGESRSRRSSRSSPAPTPRRWRSRVPN